MGINGLDRGKPKQKPRRKSWKILPSTLELLWLGFPTPGGAVDKSQRSFKRPPQPANVTSLPEPLCQRYLLRANKEALFLQRRTLIVEAENERFCHFSPLGSVSDDSREAAVRSSSGSNPRRRSTDQPGPSDLLHHDTGDDLGHPVH